MKAKLLHPLAERRHARHHRRRGVPRGGRDGSSAAAVAEAAAAETPSLAAPDAGAGVPGCDPALLRVRAAGGPLDEACYTCQCGYLFSAAVSTTVTCPHCGTSQAW